MEKLVKEEGKGGWKKEKRKSDVPDVVGIGRGKQVGDRNWQQWKSLDGITTMAKM